MKTHTASLFSLAGIVVIMAFFLFEGYLALLKPDETLPLPLTFGNFRHVRALIEMAPPKDDFSFAVAGDTRGSATFGHIIQELRREKPDFAVLVGDCTDDGSEFEHQYFQTMMKTDYALPFPVFFVIGNHDMSRKQFPVDRFEALYGPSLFSFEYGHCLFIVLRIMEAPFSNRESIEFLKRLSQQNPDAYRYRFVFMHIPPAVSGDIQARKILENTEIIELFEKLRIDCVFTSDYHGYARIMRGPTSYLISGGGGAHLDGGIGRQFYHAVMIHVEGNAVSERIIPIEKHLDAKALLERFAIVIFHPWVSRHVKAALGLNILASLCLAALFVLSNRMKPPR